MRTAGLRATAYTARGPPPSPGDVSARVVCPVARCVSPPLFALRVHEPWTARYRPVDDDRLSKQCTTNAFLTTSTQAVWRFVTPLTPHSATPLWSSQL